MRVNSAERYAFLHPVSGFLVAWFDKCANVPHSCKWAGFSMSVRAVESRFNLRTMVAEETASRPLVLTQTPDTGLFSQSIPSPVS